MRRLRRQQKHLDATRAQTYLPFQPRAIIETIVTGKVIDKVFIDKTARSALHKVLLSLIKQHNIPYSLVPAVRFQHTDPTIACPIDLKA